MLPGKLEAPASILCHRFRVIAFLHRLKKHLFTEGLNGCLCPLVFAGLLTKRFRGHGTGLSRGSNTSERGFRQRESRVSGE